MGVLVGGGVHVAGSMTASVPVRAPATGLSAILIAGATLALDGMLA